MAHLSWLAKRAHLGWLTEALLTHALPVPQGLAAWHWALVVLGEMKTLIKFGEPGHGDEKKVNLAARGVHLGRREKLSGT